MKRIEDFDLEKVKKLDRNSDEFKYFCYVVYSNCRNQKTKLNDICNELNLNVFLLNKLAKEYIKHEMRDYNNSFSASDKRDLYIYRGFDKAVGELVEQLLITDKEDEIINLLINYNKTPFVTLRNIQGYVVNMYPNNIENIYKKLEKKVEIYRKYLLDNYLASLKVSSDEFLEVRSSDALKLAKEILAKDTKTMYLKQIPNNYHIGNGVFYAIVGIWKKEHFYDVIVEKLKNNRLQRQKNFEGLIRKILPLTEKTIDGKSDSNIIKVGNSYRPLDIIDLYSYFGDDIDIIMDIFKENPSLEEEDMKEKMKVNRRYSILKKKLVTNFGCDGGLTFLKGRVDTFDSLEQAVIDRALSDRREVNFKKFDAKNFPIYGSGYVLTSEDKLRICDALHSLNLPVTLSNYDTMVRHFNNGEIELITRDNIDEYLDALNEISKKR